jgi:hypothetical protein
MDWDSNLTEEEAVASKDSFELLPDGEYDFEVKKLEKDSYTATPTSKIPSCPVAIVHIQATAPDGKTNYFRERLYLYDDNKWRLLQFFTCLGLRKHGDGKTNMPWSKVEGSTGRAQLGHHKSKKDGNDYQTVAKWLDPEPEQPASDNAEDDW